MKRFTYLTLAALVAFAACDLPPPEAAEATITNATQDQVELVTQTAHLQTNTGMIALTHTIVGNELPIPHVAGIVVQTPNDAGITWMQQPIATKRATPMSYAMIPDNGRSTGLFANTTSLSHTIAPAITATMRRAHLGSGTARHGASVIAPSTTDNLANGAHTERHLLA